MNTSRQKRAIELMAIMSSTFGTYMVATLILIFSEQISYSGHDLLLKELAIYGVWFIVSGYIFSVAHPNPTKRTMLLTSLIIVLLLLLSSSTWVNPELSGFETVSAWLESVAHIIIAIPIFIVIGHLSEQTQ